MKLVALGLRSNDRTSTVWRAQDASRCITYIIDLYPPAFCYNAQSKRRQQAPGLSFMNSYNVRVQVVLWYEVKVQARNRNDAISHAENLSPVDIQSAGEPVEAETGLADPESVTLIETP